MFPTIISLIQPTTVRDCIHHYTDIKKLMREVFVERFLAWFQIVQFYFIDTVAALTAGEIRR